MTAGDPPVLLVQRAGAVTTLVLNRPHRRNALDRRLFEALIAALASADGDPGCRAVILTGADPAFCAGADLADAADAELVAERRRTGRNPVVALLAMRTPVIGAVNGPCVTGGLELALGCDLLLASEHASFADTHLGLGMFPGWGGAALLPEAIGRRRAKELAISGRTVDAAEAVAIGLVARVVAHGALLPEARALADRIAAAPAERVAAVLHVHDEGEGRGIGERIAIERAARAALPIDVSGATSRLQAAGKG